MDSSAIIRHFEEIGRSRALTEEESRMLEKAVRAESEGGIYRRWTLEDDRMLLKAAKERCGLKIYAESVGRSYASCQNRLAELKRQRRRRGIAFKGRFFYDGEVEA